MVSVVYWWCWDGLVGCYACWEVIVNFLPRIGALLIKSCKTSNRIQFHFPSMHPFFLCKFHTIRPEQVLSFWFFFFMSFAGYSCSKIEIYCWHNFNSFYQCVQYADGALNFGWLIQEQWWACNCVVLVMIVLMQSCL